jgi:hypothetical protein
MTDELDPAFTEVLVDVADEDLPVDDPPALPSRHPGRKTRVTVLVSNVLICLGCLLASNLDSSEIPYLGQTTQMVFQIAPSVLLFGVMLTAATLAAWGPWNVVLRAVLFVSAILLVAAVELLMEYAFSSYMVSYADKGVLYLYHVFNWMCIVVPAALCMAMFGSARGLRIGPPDLPPIRITILGIMVSTAIVGALISGTIAVDTAFLESQIENLSMPEEYNPSDQIRNQTILQIVIGGPLVCLFGCCAALAAFRWVARIMIVVLPVFGGVFMYVMSASSGIPAGFEITLQIVSFWCTLMLVLAAAWVAFSVYLLDRSGWKFSRRSPGVQMQSAIHLASSNS